MEGLFEVSENTTDQKKISGEGAWIELIRWSLKKAMDSDASDLHFEPDHNSYRVRMRVFGVLTVILNDFMIRKEDLTHELKRQFNLPLSDTQSTASSSAIYPDWNLKVRSSKVRCVNGEKIVLRLIKQSKKATLENCGYIEEVQNILKKSVDKPSGVVLFVGPTGSGKSTALQALLREINGESINISTLEDPVEATIEGANQINVSKYQGFADGLRELLRQDPDVIMVGEIRDRETAELCFQAANTGHLVLTTIHANSTWAALSRLSSLGVDLSVATESINLIVSQFLVPKLCPHCSINVEPCPNLHQSDMESGINYKTVGEGCQHCQNGHSQMIPIPEVLIPDPVTLFSEKDNCKFIPSELSLKWFADRGSIDFNEAINA